MSKSNRVLIIGLDGATWDVLDPWIADASLPNLARLRHTGSWGKLRSTFPPLTAPAWSTFVTGKRPGKHGVFHFIDLFDEAQTQHEQPQIVNARSLKSSTLWDILGHYDRRLVTINVPMSYPPRPVNGIMITCFLTPRNVAVFTYPPELSNQLTDYIIDLDRFIDTKPYQGAHDPDVISPTLSLVQEFRDMEDKRAKTALSLMRSESWDAFMVVFTSTDRMGHYLWPYHRSPQPNDDPQFRQLCEAVRQNYICLDEIIGELIAQAGPDTTVMIMSDHGMGLRSSKRVHFNNWLHQQGWLVTVKANLNGASQPDDLLRKIGIPRDKVGRFIRRIPGLMKTKMIQTAAKTRSLEVDKEKSQAYCMPMFDMVMGIKINREGEQKEHLRLAISAGLEKIIDPETGDKVIEQIYRGSDYLNGAYAENIPEMIVVTKPEYRASDSLGSYSSIITKSTVPLYRGNHRMDGILLAHGPHIISNPVALDNLNIEDVTPTVLHLMGLPVPSDVDGRVLTEIITLPFNQEQSIEYSQPIGLWPNETEAVFSDEATSAEDEEQIRERLRALGYLE